MYAILRKYFIFAGDFNQQTFIMQFMFGRSVHVFLNNFECVLKIFPFFKSAVGPPNQGRAQAPYSVLSFCLLGKK